MEQDETVQYIFADRIDDPQNAMRSDMDRDSLWELSDDIKKNGLINPITIRPKGDRFEVVAGHRRLNACKMSGKVRIPCIVRDVSEEALFSIMASENLKREDVNPVDEAEFILKIQISTKKNLEEIAAMVGRGRQYVEDRLVVANMPDYLKQYLKSGQIKLGSALALMQIEEEPLRQTWVELAVRDGISVRVAEYWLYQWRRNQLPGGSADTTPPSDTPASEYRAPTFECAIDGKKYHFADVATVFVYKGNLPYIQELKQQLISTPLQT
jgi:ParB family chromosome partitioning protein